jgi:hypothetical protein
VGCSRLGSGPGPEIALAWRALRIAACGKEGQFSKGSWREGATGVLKGVYPDEAGVRQPVLGAAAYGITATPTPSGIRAHDRDGLCHGETTKPSGIACIVTHRDREGLSYEELSGRTGVQRSTLAWWGLVGLVPWSDGSRFARLCRVAACDDVRSFPVAGHKVAVGGSNTPWPTPPICSGRPEGGKPVEAACL